MEENLKSLDEQADSLCRWAAARAGAIVLVPALGVPGFFANQIYMIMRMGKLYGMDLEASAIKSFVMSLGGSFVGGGLAIAFPFPLSAVPIGVATTYATGKAAQLWIKDGLADNPSKYREEAERAKEYAKAHSQEIAADERKDTPLAGEAATY